MHRATSLVEPIGHHVTLDAVWLEQAVASAKASLITGVAVETLESWHLHGGRPSFFKPRRRNFQYLLRVLLARPTEHAYRRTADTVPTMPESTRRISLRLSVRDIEQLKARAHTVSGTITGVARELILTGLAGGDNKALAERLMVIERRRAAVENLAREVDHAAQQINTVVAELRAKFDALLRILSSDEGTA